MNRSKLWHSQLLGFNYFLCTHCKYGFDAQFSKRTYKLYIILIKTLQFITIKINYDYVHWSLSIVIAHDIKILFCILSYIVKNKYFVRVWKKKNVNKYKLLWS